MKNKIMKISILLLAVLVTLTMIGCGARDYKGTEKEKIAPQIRWADIGISPTHSQNPNLRWYSTDADGQVLDYQYCVFLDSVVTALGGADAVASNFPADAQWTVVHEDSATIQLFASPDTSVFLVQYIFLRAMDDDSLFSPIIYKSLARNNHAPTCYLLVPWQETRQPDGRRNPGEPIDPQWCLPETTATWHGIRVAWVGKDSIDIKGIQPDFEWNIRLYGPFPDSASTDTMSGDLAMQLTDPNTGSEWVLTKQYFFTNLQTGWYVVYARNRDDAFVPSIPAIDYLRIFEPTWIRNDNQTKPILLANHNYYWPGPSVPDPYAGELRILYKDSVEQFYRTLLQNAGYTPDQYDWADYTIGNTELVPQKIDLYNHRLVIVLDTDWTHQFKTDTQLDQETPYGQYLDVGGMLWILGRRSFELQGAAGRNDFGAPNHPFAVRYINLSATYDERTTLPLQAEFTGALSLISNFPDVMVAPERVAQTSNTNYHYTNTLRGIGYVIRMGDSETIYKYNAIEPDTSSFHNFPVAIRYNKGTWKSSYFAFPLYFLSESDALTITQRMLEWFFEGVN